MEFQLKHKHAWIINAYLAPISDRGLVACWRGKHSLYRKGYVLRVLWLGLVIRWSYIKAERRPTYSYDQRDDQRDALEYARLSHEILQNQTPQQRTLDETIADATALVTTWPAWKQNILKHSASPTVSVPRKPVKHEPLPPDYDDGF